MIASYAFLWRDRDVWHVQMPYGPAGSGATQEAAFASLRDTLHARLRTIESPTTAPSAFEALLREAGWTQPRGELAREQAEDIERFGFDDCLLIAPEAFAALLEEQCTRLTERELRRSSEYRRLLGRDSPRSVSSVSDHPFGSWLRRYRLLWIDSELYDLQVHSHWYPGSAGIFAFDGSTLIHLDGRVEPVQSLLQTERPSLDEIAPARVAELFAEVVCRRGKAHHSLATVESLERMDASGGYVLDRRELARISPLPAATLESSTDSWILRFATSYGELGMDDEIHEWRVEISRRFEIQVRIDLLSSRIFESRPIVME